MNTELSSDTTPEQMELTLNALRFSYQRIISDFENFTDYARKQLSHIEALLSSSSPNQSSVNSSIDYNQDTAVSLTSFPRTKEKESQGVVKNPLSITSGRRKRNNSLKVIKFYEQFTMHEAIAYVLNQNKGKALDADTIVQELYGSLAEQDFRTAKDRITKSLSKGKQEGKWYRVPDQLGAYTSSLER